MKRGFIYVQTHPSNPDLYKIGVTILEPTNRLAQHNQDFTKAAGRVVEETGQKWELKEFHSVPDPYWAEKVFWQKVPQSDIPYRGGVEVEIMSWEEVSIGLAAAKSAGVRPDVSAIPVYESAYDISVKRHLVGRGISLLGHVKSIVSGRNDFQCSNGHQWRTIPKLVMDGVGCPECGVGVRTPQEMRLLTNAGVIGLLTNPNQPGFINVGAWHGSIEELGKNYPWGDWGLERYRKVEEVDIAESVIWELLGRPLPHDRNPIEMDLEKAKEVFRSLIYVLRERIALQKR